MAWTRIESSQGSIIFGADPFILTGIVVMAAAIQAGELGERSVEVHGCIIPGGAEEEARRAEMERGRRLLSRVVCGEGVTLYHGGRTLRVQAEAVPEFRTDAPWNGADAAAFILRFRSVGDHAYTGTEEIAGGWGLEGKMVFPLVFREETVWGHLAESGEIILLNPGEIGCGFAAEIRADGGTIESVRLSLGDSMISIAHAIPEGESMVIDTRTGQKGVWCGTESVMADVDWESDFFLLPPGESKIHWHAPGAGHAAVEVRFTPRYAVG